MEDREPESTIEKVDTQRDGHISPCAPQTPQIFTFSPPGSPRRDSTHTVGGTWSDSGLNMMDTTSSNDTNTDTVDTSDVNEGSDEIVPVGSSSLPSSSAFISLYGSKKSRGRSISVPSLPSLELEAETVPAPPAAGAYGLLSPTSSSASLSPREEKSADGATSSDSSRGRPNLIPRSLTGALAEAAASGHSENLHSSPGTKGRHKVNIKQSPDTAKTKRGTKNRNKHKSDSTNHSPINKQNRTSGGPADGNSGEETPSIPSSPGRSKEDTKDEMKDDDSGSASLSSASYGEGGSKKEGGKRNILQRGQKLVRSKSRSTSPSHVQKPQQSVPLAAAKSDSTTSATFESDTIVSAPISGSRSESMISSNNNKRTKSDPNTPRRVFSRSPSSGSPAELRRIQPVVSFFFFFAFFCFLEKKTSFFHLHPSSFVLLPLSFVL